MPRPICRHWEHGRCNFKYCGFLHDGPGGLSCCPRWVKGECTLGESCAFIHGPDPPPPVDLKKMRCPTLDCWKRCDLQDDCPYSHKEWMDEYFNRQCPAELNGYVCTSRDSACRYRLHKGITKKAKGDKVKEERAKEKRAKEKRAKEKRAKEERAKEGRQTQAHTHASSPPETVWRTNPVIVDGTCGRRPKPRNDNGPDKVKTAEHADAAPSDAAPSEAAPAEPLAANSISCSSDTVYCTPRARRPGMAYSKSDPGTDPGTTTAYQSWADEVEDEPSRKTPSRKTPSRREPQ